jgi:hypothetical protein
MKYIFLLLLCSCSDFLDQNHYEVDAELQYYTNKFFYEASARGMNVKPNNLIVRLGNCQKEDGVIGITKYHSITTVIIDSDFFASRSADTLMIETIVFHEMGHAVFHRDHCDTYSLMNPNKHISDYRLNPSKRTILIDELMNPSNRLN